MNNLIIFDGDCNFCNFYINKLINLDTRRNFYFTSYNSKLADKLMTDAGFSSDYKESFILFMDGEVFIKSEAVIVILKKLAGFWKVPAWVMKYMIPRFIRDWCYDRIAKNRYVISKNFDSCQIPTPEMRSRFK